VSKASGIYGIRCLPTGKVYIGSAINFLVRWYNHKYLLDRGKHYNFILQAAWEKYGSSAFNFFIVELVEAADLLKRETWHISAFNAANRLHGFNIEPTAYSRLGFPHTNETKKKLSIMKMGNQARLGQRHTEEARAKISASQKGKTISVEQRAKLSIANIGNVNSSATRAKISIANKGKAKPYGFGRKVAEAQAFFSESQVRDLRNAVADGTSRRSLGRIFQTSLKVISRAVDGRGPFYSSIL